MKDLQARIDLAIATAIGDGASPDAVEAITLAREAVKQVFESDDVAELLKTEHEKAVAAARAERPEK